MAEASRRLELAVVGEDDNSEADSEAEEQLLASFATTQKREKTEIAAVEIRRYQNVPQRDPGGKLVRRSDGKSELGPLVLYFRRLDPGTLMSLREDFTVKKPVRRGGRVQFDESFDADGFAVHMAYLSMLPWCRSMYFDNSKLWGDDIVGTGEEFLRARLNMGELSYCLDAIQQLEGMGEEQATKLGKRSNQADAWISG
jgi:hypothetical protein